MSNEAMSYLVGGLATAQVVQAVLIYILFNRGIVNVSGMNARAYFSDGKPMSRELFEKAWNDSLDEMKMPRSKGTP